VSGRIQEHCACTVQLMPMLVRVHCSKPISPVAITLAVLTLFSILVSGRESVPLRHLLSPSSAEMVRCSRRSKICAMLHVCRTPWRHRLMMDVNRQRACQSPGADKGRVAAILRAVGDEGGQPLLHGGVRECGVLGGRHRVGPLAIEPR